jgi:thioredoxin-related protein
MKQKVVVLFFIITISGFSFSLKDNGKKVNWISFQDAEKKLLEKELPVIVDVYTDWCGWCKVMDSKTYSKPNVAYYLNNKFYAIKFNAESTEDITWRGKVYRYDPQKGIHSLALALITGEKGYPNTVFIPNKQAEPVSVPGYMTPKEFQVFLTYFGEKKYNSSNFETYAKDFKPSW